MATAFKFLVHFVEQDIGQERGQHSLNAKGNFCFDRLVGLDRSCSVLDLRLKK
jgi:hypothetical protein